MKIAIMADIHSNAPALEAVLSDISRYDIHHVVHLGDAFNGPVDPVGVAKLLQEQQIIHVRGNGERMVLSEDETERFRSANFARDRLSADHLQWIRSWPVVYQQDDFFACHGSPTSDTEHLLEEITAGGVRLRDIRAIQTDLEGIHSSLILCAHSHIPRLVRIHSGTWVLNPGSVGLPAYSDTSPYPHTMEVGSPSARYAIAEKHSLGWYVSHVAVPYDYEKAASIADREGFSSWASALRTGYLSS
jgi:predicted phosphodiesterase